MASRSTPRALPRRKILLEPREHRLLGHLLHDRALPHLGALLVVAEAAPSPRVRVARAEMREGTVVKEMSEQTVLARLEKDLAARESARG